MVISPVGLSSTQALVSRRSIVRVWRGNEGLGAFAAPDAENFSSRKATMNLLPVAPAKY